jgi:ATP-dependent protease ClpP protease subunit
MNNNLGSDSHEDEMGVKSPRIRVASRQSNDFTIFIDDDIDEPSAYRDELYLLITASENDSINIPLLTRGGSMDTALAFEEMLKLSKAESTAILMGGVASAGTIIALSCTNVAVLDSATFMIHTASFGSMGQTNHVKAHVDFSHECIHEVIDRVYEGFLTPVEIQSVKDGTELWLKADAIRDRLKARLKYFEAKAKKEEQALKKTSTPQRKKPIVKSETPQILEG